MKKLILGAVLGFAVLFSTFNICAEEARGYLLFSAGSGYIKELGVTQVEDRLLAEQNIFGSYNTNSKSIPYSFGFGYYLFKNVMVEYVHRAGLQGEVNGRFRFEGNILGEAVKTDIFDVKRSGTLIGDGINLLGQVRIYDSTYLTGKIGALYTRVEVFATATKIPYDIEAVRRIEGVIPVVGIGLMFKPKESKSSLSFEVETYGKYVILYSLTWRRHFHF